MGRLTIRRFEMVLRVGLLAVAFLVGLCAAPVQAQTRSERPNVLLIMSDDLNDDMMTFGHPVVRTPNLERLAARGVRFERAYAQFALCNPSRASLMTGMRPDSIGVYDLTTHFRESVPDVTTLPQAFRNAGYYAARVGKIYHYGNPSDVGTSGLDDAASWEHVINPRGIDIDEGRLVSWAGPSRGLGASLSYYASPAPDEAHTDGMVATEAIELLEQHRNEPFFIAAGFYRPHCPFIAPQKYFDLYPDLDRIPVSEYSEVLLRQSPTASRGIVWDVPLDEQREAIRAYYASISFMDAQVGRLLDALDRLGLAENTIVVFMSDHGYHLGDHGGLWMKQSLFERSTRTPLIVAGANVVTRGAVSRRVVELIDLYPTLTDLAGLPRVSTVEGRSLVPLLADPQAEWDHGALSQSRRSVAAVLGGPAPAGRGAGAGAGAGPGAGPGARGGRGGRGPGSSAPQAVGYSIRTERWRYIEWDEGREGRELYDVFNDPGELHNLAGSAAYAGDVDRLAARLRQIRATASGPNSR
jgi:iduronate 2-sulfatase